MTELYKSDYQRRLFGGGLRKPLHMARYHWLNRQIAQEIEGAQKSWSMLDFGCHDGLTLEFLKMQPSRYLGLDNDASSIDLARKRYAAQTHIRFEVTSNVREMLEASSELFDTIIALETLEHLPIKQLDSYLQALAKCCARRAYFSVPVEHGMVFFAKHIAKRVLHPKNETEPYSLREFILSSAGYPGKVEPIEGGHKGFDWRQCVESIAKSFEITSIASAPFSILPVGLSAGVVIAAKPKSLSK